MASSEGLPPHVSNLDRNLPKLLDNINITTSRLWDYMISNRVIGFTDVEDIKVQFNTFMLLVR